ncbi:hypothetical protein B0I35DRAFT_464246 [Stachybotrys elegans]|uniref:Zn(2)-C6 fungal-type domain-containing protein n=1 Tax=Stachybotrys elegans TaxID=80388 RepID=A0A8K0SLD8_9HYPO|nr:hypothetical protein B0I35DRAFT_464246 [Stachybotrys elegans]
MKRKSSTLLQKAAGLSLANDQKESDIVEFGLEAWHQRALASTNVMTWVRLRKVSDGARKVAGWLRSPRAPQPTEAPVCFSWFIFGDASAWQATPEYSVAPVGPEDLAGRKVCDQCRLRKIRCDKEWPCSNCRTSKRTCTSTGAGQRPKESRQRVLISSQYERKIDRIENRLANIESLLHKMTLSGSSSQTPDHSFNHLQTPPTAPQSTSVADAESSDDEDAFGGDSGITAHTAFATDFLQRAVKRTSLKEVNPKMETALANLSQLVEMRKSRSISHGPRFPLQQPLPPGGLGKLPMPPIASVVSVLREAANGPPSLFTLLCSLAGIFDFTGLCRQVYFATEDFSDATFLLVNAGLYNLYVELQALATEPPLRAQYQSYVHMCRVNIETTLANLPLFLSPKLEVIQALLLGTLYAIDVSRPSVAWHLNSAAAELCQTARFHRVTEQDEVDPKVTQIQRVVFWHIHMLDKCLGLRLGRASVIQDYDIDIPRTYDFLLLDSLHHVRFLDLWIYVSTLQGKIYEELYSPAALAQPPEELARKARAIAAKYDEVGGEVEQAREEVISHLADLGSADLVRVFLKGDEVQFQVILTMVYRVIRAPEGSVSRFCDECLQSARKAMAIHLETVALLRGSANYKAIYFHWNLLLLPYAPFFVLFCYVIETLSIEDLQILDLFINSLEAGREGSETVENLYRLCKVMYDAAALYVEAKTQQQEDQTMIPIGDEFEMYLSQLGFMPSEGDAMPGSTNTANGMGMGMTSPFAGDRNMMGLLEEDLSQMQAWMQQDNDPM